MRKSAWQFGFCVGLAALFGGGTLAGGAEVPHSRAKVTFNHPFFYIASRLDNTLSVADGKNEVKVIYLSNWPRQVAASPDGNFVYTTIPNTNSVAVIDTRSNAVVTTIGVGPSPFGLAVSPTEPLLAVANFGSNTITLIDTATNTVTDTIVVGNAPRDVAFAPNGHTLYSANNSKDNSGSVSVIAVTGRKVIATISGIPEAQHIVVSPDGQRAYVSWHPQSVYFLDLVTNTIAANVNVMSDPDGLALSADGSRLYVSNNHHTFSNSSMVSVIDTASASEVKRVDMGSWRDGEIFATPDFVYSTSHNPDIGLLNTANSTFAYKIDSLPANGFLLGDYGDTVTGVVGGGSGTITSSVIVAGGTSARLSVQPNAGNQIAGVTTDACNGTLTGNTYTTGALATRTCTVTATFAPIPAPNCIATSSPGNRTVIDCSGVAPGAALKVVGATCNPPSSGTGHCSGNTSSTGTTPNVTVALNGGTLTVAAQAQFEVQGVVGSGSGTITPSQIVARGNSAVLFVQPNVGSHIALVATDGCDGGLSGNTYTTDAINAACVVTATFATDTFAISAVANPSAGGSVTCTPNPVPYDGASTCTATANTGYAFAGFKGDCAGKTCTLSKVVRAQSVIANFTLLTFQIATSANPAVGGSVTCTPNPVSYGGNSTCTAAASPGYVFAGFNGDCSGATCSLSNVVRAQSVTADFTLLTFAIATSANPAAGGSVTCTPNPVSYGGNSTCTATANPGYTFAGFNGDCSGATCSLSNVLRVQSVTANFTAITFPIATHANPTVGGNVICTPNPVPYAASGSCSATANAGFVFLRFSGDCIGATCTLPNVTAPRSVVAEFAAAPPAAVDATPANGAGSLAVLGLLLLAVGLARRRRFD